MITVPGTCFAYFDVDDTLALWSPTQEQSEKYGIDIECPGSFIMVEGEIQPSPAFIQRIVPHKAHIEQIKKHKLRGHTVVVWSAGGWDWAEAVVKAFKLEQYVDLVISKPMWAYDDLQPNEFIPKPIWMKDE